MRKEDCLEVLKQNLKTSAGKLKLGCHWVFHQDNDPKRSSKIVAKWLKDNKVKVMEWPSQSPDINLIKNLSTALKKRPRTRRPTNLTELHRHFNHPLMKEHHEKFLFMYISEDDSEIELKHCTSSHG